MGIVSGILCAAVLEGCGAAEEPVVENTEFQKVELVVWGAEEDTELMNQIIQSFQANPSDRNLQEQLEDMGDITGRMDTNREIVEDLKKQMEVFSDF